METDFKDNQLHELLSNSRKEMPFLNFEEETMAEIHEEQVRNKSVLKNIKLSWFFFLLGLIAGMILISFSSSNPQSNGQFLTMQSIAYFIIILVSILLIFNKLIEYSLLKKH